MLFKNAHRSLSILVPAVLLVSCSGWMELGAVSNAGSPSTPAPAETVGLPPENTSTPQPTITPTSSPTQVFKTYDQSEAMLPQFNQDVDAFPQATRYLIDVQIDFAEDSLDASIQGEARIHYTNTTDEDLRDLVLMLWPNQDQYASTITAGPVWVDDVQYEATEEPGGVALRIVLPDAIESGEAVELRVPFRIEAEPFDPFSPRRFGTTQGVLIAPTFYPLIPRLVEGEWEVASPPPAGDTTNSEVAFYQLHFTYPSDLTLVASGVEVEGRVNGGITEATYVTGPMRDVAFALGPFRKFSREVQGVEVNSWLLEDHIPDEPIVADAAGTTLALLNDLVGPYPYKELDVVDAPGAFGGIEYPGLVYIGTVGTSWMIEPTVHEVAHQWFYGIIGGDQILEPWLDEGLATYAEALYYERAFGYGRSTGFLSQLRSAVRNGAHPTWPIGLGVGEFESSKDYGDIIYQKGALFIDALRRHLGDDVFFTFIHDYYNEFRYDVATTRDFQTSAEAACDCDLDALFNLWVYEGGEIADLSR
jgi:hypothetical protein